MLVKSRMVARRRIIIDSEHTKDQKCKIDLFSEKSQKSLFFMFQTILKENQHVHTGVCYMRVKSKDYTFFLRGPRIIL